MWVEIRAQPTQTRNSDASGVQGACRTLKLRRGGFGHGRVLGRGSFVFGEESVEGERRVTVRLTRRGRTLVRRRHGAWATASIDGVGLPIAWTLRLNR